MTDSLDLTDVLAIAADVGRSTSSDSFGVTASGFVPKPFARLLAEKIALAQRLVDPDIDLSSGSVLRKILELTSLEDARTWAALGSAYDDCFVGSARGPALSALGQELGLDRPFACAQGTVTITLAGALPPATPVLVLPRGSRLTTAGGHRVALASQVTLSAAVTSLPAPVVSFDPGPIGNLDPAHDDGSGNHPQTIDRWEPADAKLSAMVSIDVEAGFPAQASASGTGLVRIQHTEPLAGGEVQWSDADYRDLLLRAPRGPGSVEALTTTVSLVPGVRQVTVRDGWGGLDLSQSIFSDFDFVERLFAAERDLANPYFVTVLVAPTESAVWSGPGGLQDSVESAIRDVRPVGVFPEVVEADQVYVAVQADVITRGLVLPPGTSDIVNASPAALAVKERLAARLHQVVDSLAMGEPVRTSAVLHALMSEPGISDVVHLRLVRYPRLLDRIGTSMLLDVSPQVLGRDESLHLSGDQIAVLVDRPELLVLR
ncbi:MAG TPA: hypothetical protein VHW64_13715 [Nocardioides sp.]|jgi:hypothetical protein|uniref:hypothetical protein n=1 Tax=Nocardioides sp. TaxID=35761 RepID=UPI002E3382EC|nr:hypothetical protein [Nocardioides sp.]HEX3931758.1 hypothetical protein [Nocardioides sp.]